MAERNPPYVQALTYNSQEDRLLLSSLVAAGAGEGVVGASDLAVTQNGTPNMSVNVAAGSGFIKGDEATYQGMYHGVLDSVKNLAVGAYPGAGLTRQDLVVARLKDASYSGATNAFSVEIVSGTAAATGSQTDPAIPSNAIALARLTLTGTGTTVLTANITNLRIRAFLLGGPAVCTSTTRPAHSAGLVVWEMDKNRFRVSDGVAWRWIGGKAVKSLSTLNTNPTSIATTATWQMPALATSVDTDSLHTGTNGYVTITEAGLYRISVRANFASNATGARAIGFHKAGTAFSSGAPSHNLLTAAANATTVQPTTETYEIELVAGDVISLVVWQSSGGALNITEAELDVRLIGYSS